LAAPHIRAIVHLQIKRLQKQLQERGIELTVSDAAIDAIAHEGYDPIYGARPLKRAIQQRIQNPLAVELLKQRLPEGSRVLVDYVDGQFTFTRSEAPAAAAS
jgi:ATP-dependent Clp protease ATP-binding subunit ClpB